ncbi:hypothetical protein DID88_001486 [Monilinia fructigena]|uniref:Fe2OG dioxygenase domain-containing protein n=1 Tax=Monilinia fructigena TaxID=38457 RepID=A0A395IXK2_9HELO|nr:hypothetical protein DID88_001486 [Monilinia fructigena]
MSIETAKAVDADNLVIPIINFSNFLTGSPSQRLQTAKSILYGFRTAALLKAQAPDLKESFEIGREGEEELPNNWPPITPEDGDAKEFKRDHASFPRLIAGDNTLRLLHYPPAKASVFRENKLQVRAGEHTDYGSITLLFQDDRGGLQVKSPKGTFVDATPVPGTVVVNAGDLLARWSNDLIKSTLHRVVEPPPKEGQEIGEEGVYPARYSMAYFCNPNFDRMIEAIEGTYGGEMGERKYEGINSGEYLVQRLAATY